MIRSPVFIPIPAFTDPHANAILFVMSTKTWILIIIVILAIGGIYYLGFGQQPAADGGAATEQASGESPDSSMQAAPQGGAQPQSPPSSKQSGAGADIDAEVSAVASDGQTESTQAASENGAESAAQFNSSLDNQSVYAE